MKSVLSKKLPGWIWVVLALIGCSLKMEAALDRCGGCGVVIARRFHVLVDAVDLSEKAICLTCFDEVPRCWACQIPAKLNRTTLKDGRILCERDVRNAILSESEAQDVCRGVRMDLDRLFSRFTHFPDKFSLHILDQPEINKLMGNLGTDKSCGDLYGCFRKVSDGSPPDISILSGLSRAALRATTAHELGHFWVVENVKARPCVVERFSGEGFCELLGFLLMEEDHAELEMRLIRENSYSRGQFQLFLEAERRYGFNTVLEWMRYGEDDQLKKDDLDRIRVIKTRTPSTAIPAPAPFVFARPPSRPESLKLKGVFRSGGKRAALINNQLFSLHEQFLMPLLNSNVTVRCEEITDTFVLIVVEGSPGTQKLSLP